MLGDPQRGFACLVIRPNVADDRGIDRVPKNDQGVISHLGSILPVRESARNYDVRIRGADQETKFLKRAGFSAQFRDRIAQFAFALGSSGLECILLLRMFQFALRRGEIGIGR